MKSPFGLTVTRRLATALMVWILSAMSQSFSLQERTPDPQLSSHDQLACTSLYPNDHQGHRDRYYEGRSWKGWPLYGSSGLARHWSVGTDHSRLLDRSAACNLTDFFANCSSLDLRYVPQNLSVDIRGLDLHNNSLTELSNCIFAEYFKLQYLNLSRNNISSLQSNTFYNLSSLKELNLCNNSLLLRPSVYPDQVFCPLAALTSLDISLNTANVTISKLQYPDVALACLKNLESLSIDGLPMSNQSPTFCKGFNNLTRLTRLTMRGLDTRYCMLGGLYEHSFINVENLESLSLHGCNIQGRNVSYNAFHTLRRLQKLDISANSQIGFYYLKAIFAGLCPLENLTELNMAGIVSPYSTGNCLTSTTITPFPQHLTTLNAVGNNIEAVEEDVIGFFPPNLTTLVLSGNRFTLGAYLLKLSSLEKLTTLYLNHYDRYSKFPRFYPFLNEFLIPAYRNCTTFLEKKRKFVLQLPPNLQSVEMNNAGLNIVWTKLTINESNSLTNLSVYGNQFHYLQGPIQGLHSLKYLDISLCSVRRIHPHFFDNLSSLQVLRLGSNFLGRFLSNDANQDVFDALTNLTILNLTSNAIVYLPSRLFKKLKNLTALYLRNNAFDSFDLDLSPIAAIGILDLAQTHVATLPRRIQDYFDILVKKQKMNVSIFMESTPINCKCHNLQFLKWMTTSKVFFKPFHNYYCNTVYNHKRITDDYDEVLRLLKKRCSSHTVILCTLATITIAVSCLIVWALLYRFRWNIRYMYYAVYLHFKKTTTPSGNSREYDAFICYASENAEFAEMILEKELSDRGLKIFLHGRDFKAGDYISSNIVNAVCSSRKTVVLLTEALLDSYWCGYEIEMAKMEGVHSGRPVLIFVILEKVSKRKLGRDLLYNIKNNTYVEYSTSLSDTDEMRTWWNKLANDIRD